MGIGVPVVITCSAVMHTQTERLRVELLSFPRKGAWQLFGMNFQARRRAASIFPRFRLARNQKVIFHNYIEPLGEVRGLDPKGKGLSRSMAGKGCDAR